MRYELKRGFQPIYATSRAILGATFMLALLAGCEGGRLDQIQVQLEAYQGIFDRQLKSIESLSQQIEQQQHQINQLLGKESLDFAVTDLTFQQMEKAFEPLVIGSANLQIVNKAKPDLIFVEWSLEIVIDGEQLAPISFIQRVEKGVAKLEFAQPLPRHNVKKGALKVKVQPTGWYMAHVARLVP